MIDRVPKLLIVDDDHKLVALVRDYLEPQGFEIEVAADGITGLDAALSTAADLVILDLMLPGLDGLEVCRRLRAQSQIPVLMLTARGDDTDRIVGLEMGADDYLPKPFNPRELLARIRAILRRSPRPSSEPSDSDGWIDVEGLALHPGSRRAVLDDAELDLTTAEFDLLLALARSAGRVLSREVLLDQVHGPGWAAISRSVDVHISRIRHKIEIDPRRPRRLKTVRGVGYMICRPSRDGGEVEA